MNQTKMKTIADILLDIDQATINTYDQYIPLVWLYGMIIDLNDKKYKQQQSEIIDIDIIIPLNYINAYNHAIFCVIQNLNNTTRKIRLTSTIYENRMDHTLSGRWNDESVRKLFKSFKQDDTIVYGYSDVYTEDSLYIPIESDIFEKDVEKNFLILYLRNIHTPSILFSKDEKNINKKKLYTHEPNAHNEKKSLSIKTLFKKFWWILVIICVVIIISIVIFYFLKRKNKSVTNINDTNIN